MKLQEAIKEARVIVDNEAVGWILHSPDIEAIKVILAELDRLQKENQELRDQKPSGT